MKIDLKRAADLASKLCTLYTVQAKIDLKHAADLASMLCTVCIVRVKVF